MEKRQILGRTTSDALSYIKPAPLRRGASATAHGFKLAGARPQLLPSYRLAGADLGEPTG